MSTKIGKPFQQASSSTSVQLFVVAVTAQLASREMFFLETFKSESVWLLHMLANKVPSVLGCFRYFSSPPVFHAASEVYSLLPACCGVMVGDRVLAHAKDASPKCFRYCNALDRNGFSNR